jgi:hypothetical protein
MDWAKCGDGSFEGIAMIYQDDVKPKKNDDVTDNQHLVLDGTVNLDYSDDEEDSRIKGLIELLKGYFDTKHV